MLHPVQCSLRKCIAEGTADAEIKGKPKLKSTASPIHRNGIKTKQAAFFPTGFLVFVKDRCLKVAKTRQPVPTCAEQSALVT